MEGGRYEAGAPQKCKLYPQKSIFPISDFANGQFFANGDCRYDDEHGGHEQGHGVYGRGEVVQDVAGGKFAVAGVCGSECGQGRKGGGECEFEKATHAWYFLDVTEKRVKVENVPL